MKDQYCELALEMFLEYEIIFIADGHPPHDVSLSE